MINTRAIIIEDDRSIQVVISAMIAREAPSIEIIAKERSVARAVMVIKTLKPDLVFLDIEIIGGVGFDVLKQTKDLDYEVIFITAHSEYAIEALRANAIDYIVKPIVRSDFSAALKRYEDRLRKIPHSFNILIRGYHKDTKVAIDDILYIEIEKFKTTFHLIDKRFIRSIKSISSYDLPDTLFQIHRNFIVNTSYIISIDPGRAGKLLLSNDKELPIAYRRKSQLKKVWNPSVK